MTPAYLGEDLVGCLHAEDAIGALKVVCIRIECCGRLAYRALYHCARCRFSRRCRYNGKFCSGWGRSQAWF